MTQPTQPDFYALPWFVERMTDDWHFGLKLTNGETLGIRTIHGVRRLEGDVWLDVDLLTEDAFDRGVTVAANKSRTRTSVNTRHVLYATDLGD